MRASTVITGEGVARSVSTEAASLLAAPPGFPRRCDDDPARPEAATGRSDPLHLQAQDGTAETHHWPAAAGAAVPA